MAAIAVRAKGGAVDLWSCWAKCYPKGSRIGGKRWLNRGDMQAGAAAAPAAGGKGGARRRKRRRGGPLFSVLWFRVVLDEAQSIKNSRTLASHASWSLQARLGSGWT